jgi:hypothetical protein
MKTMTKRKGREIDTMRAEYDFKGGVRGKHSQSMLTGYTITIHKTDGTTVVKNTILKEGVILLEPDVRECFPDSESVNKALRCLIPLLPKKQKMKQKLSV